MSNENPIITHAVTLSEHNFIVRSLNRNPLQVDVMEVAQLITKLNTSASEQLAPKPAAPEAPPSEKTTVAAAVDGL